MQIVFMISFQLCILASLIIFNIALKGNETKRIIQDIPIQLITKNTVIYEDEQFGYIYYFNQSRLTNSIDEYLGIYFEQIDTKTYTFFNYDEQGRVTLETFDKPQNLQVHVIVNYFSNFKVDQYVTFKASMR